VSAPIDDENVLLLETINPADLTVKELWDLSDELHAKIPQLYFVPAYEEQHGAGVTWHEVIRIWVENEDILKSAAFEVALASIIEAMRKRFKKKHGGRRPKSIIVNDRTTGKELMSLTLNEPDSEAIEVDITMRIRSVPQRQERPHD
jgi:hypothetical protein